MTKLPWTPPTITKVNPVRKRFAYIVMIDQDPVPGFNHQPEDMKMTLERYLENVSHYNPTVVRIEIDESQTAHIIGED